MKTALVAGGAGFVGSHLCEYLLKKNYRVYVLDNLVTGRKQNIQHLLQDKNFSWIEHDIINPLFMNVPCDEIYNLASPASPVDFDRIPDFILKTAALGHMNLLNWAVQHQARILLASTSEVYGDPLEHPQREDYLGNVDCVGPRGCYDEAKRFAEALSVAYKKSKNAQIRIARIFNTYGPRMRPEDGRVIPNFYTQALRREPLTIYGDGTQTRSLCYVEDLVEGLFRLMQSTYTEPVNLGNPDEYTISQIAEKISEVCGVAHQTVNKPLPPRDPKQRKPDITRAMEILNWKPTVSLKDGLANTLKYFRAR